jgi:hypothetical protein
MTRHITNDLRLSRDEKPKVRDEFLILLGAALADPAYCVLLLDAIPDDMDSWGSGDLDAWVQALRLENPTLLADCCEHITHERPDSGGTIRDACLSQIRTSFSDRLAKLQRLRSLYRESLEVKLGLKK